MYKIGLSMAIIAKNSPFRQFWYIFSKKIKETVIPPLNFTDYGKICNLSSKGQKKIRICKCFAPG
jgi:hypothetical protein